MKLRSKAEGDGQVTLVLRYPKVLSREDSDFFESKHTAAVIIISLLTSCVKDSFVALLGWHNEESSGIWQGLKYHKPC